MKGDSKQGRDRVTCKTRVRNQVPWTGTVALGRDGRQVGLDLRITLQVELRDLVPEGEREPPSHTPAPAQQVASDPQFGSASKLCDLGSLSTPASIS